MVYRSKVGPDFGYPLSAYYNLATVHYLRLLQHNLFNTFLVLFLPMEAPTPCSQVIASLRETGDEARAVNQLLDGSPSASASCFQGG